MLVFTTVTPLVTTWYVSVTVGGVDVALALVMGEPELVADVVPGVIDAPIVTLVVPDAMARGGRVNAAGRGALAFVTYVWGGVPRGRKRCPARPAEQKPGVDPPVWVALGAAEPMPASTAAESVIALIVTKFVNPPR